jgi:hypothetical protein
MRNEKTWPNQVDVKPECKVHIRTLKGKTKRKISDDELAIFVENPETRVFQPNDVTHLLMNIKSKEPRLGVISFIGRNFISSREGDSSHRPLWNGRNYVYPIIQDEIYEIELRMDHNTYVFKVETPINFIEDNPGENFDFVGFVVTYSGDMQQYIELYCKCK